MIKMNKIAIELKKKCNESIFFNYNENSNQVSGLIDGEMKELPGFWPLINEKMEETNFICVGSKSGIPENYEIIKNKLSSDFKYIYNCQSGPFFLDNLEYIYNNFDGVFDLDYKKRNKRKSLYCNHSMMVRSMPYKNFFWDAKNNINDKKYDFSILTWFNDHKSKRFDRAMFLADYLCAHNLKGIIVTQRGKKEDFNKTILKKYIDSGVLFVDDSKYNEIDFHNFFNDAKVSIFPNQIDAFPKHIIESLLADKPIIISADLLLGVKILKKLNKNVVKVVNFNSKSSNKKIMSFIQKNKFIHSPRKEYLEHYSFDKLSKKWAEEFNRLYKTNHQRLFFLNHICRIVESGIKL